MVRKEFRDSCDLLKNSYLCLLNNTWRRKKGLDAPVVICWKIRIFAYWTTPDGHAVPPVLGCDLLKNSYLCLLNNTLYEHVSSAKLVVICWKIRIFAYWTTPRQAWLLVCQRLWFAEKFVSLLIEQHQCRALLSFVAGCDLLKNSYLCLLNNTAPAPAMPASPVVICWKIRIFAYWTTPSRLVRVEPGQLWFAEKFVSLLIEQHPSRPWTTPWSVVICWKIRIFAYWTTPGQTCKPFRSWVVICWKIRIFAYWTTPFRHGIDEPWGLWFAEKFVSLLIEQHQTDAQYKWLKSCDLLKNSYLCLLNNTARTTCTCSSIVVICWKIRIFAYWTTPDWPFEWLVLCCDLLKNSYLCLLNNTRYFHFKYHEDVVICWKIRIFAYWTTPCMNMYPRRNWLWFAEKFVSLLIEQHRGNAEERPPNGCDLLKNSYLCLLNNTQIYPRHKYTAVVICWKIRIFAYWTTPISSCHCTRHMLWFAEKFVSLLIEQHQILSDLTSVRVVICWKIRIFAYWTTPQAVTEAYKRLLWFAEKFVSLLIEQHLSLK